MALSEAMKAALKGLGYTPEQIAEEVWERMKPVDTYLPGEDQN
jgi:hypothetical protein